MPKDSRMPGDRLTGLSAGPREHLPFRSGDNPEDVKVKEDGCVQRLSWGRLPQNRHGGASIRVVGGQKLALLTAVVAVPPAFLGPSYLTCTPHMVPRGYQPHGVWSFSILRTQAGGSLCYKGPPGPRAEVSPQPLWKQLSGETGRRTRV